MPLIDFEKIADEIYILRQQTGWDFITARDEVIRRHPYLRDDPNYAKTEIGKICGKRAAVANQKRKRKQYPELPFPDPEENPMPAALLRQMQIEESIEMAYERRDHEIPDL